MPTVSEEFLVEFEQLAARARRESDRGSDSSRVERTPGVCGGDARVRDTRLPVWILIGLQKLGRAESDLLSDYPSLSQADLDAVWAYYRTHLAEVDAAIARNEDESV